MKETCFQSPQNPCQLGLGRLCLGFKFRGACAHVAAGQSDWIDLVHSKLNSLPDPPRPEPNQVLAEHHWQLSGNAGRLPPLWRQAWSLLQALWKHMRNGLPQTPAGLRQSRLETCRACPHFLPENERCGVCGCFLATKISWQLATCPKGNW